MNIIDRIANLGLKPDFSPEEKRSLRIINIMSIIVSIICFKMIILNFFLKLPFVSILSSFIILLLVHIPLVLNKLQKLYASKISFSVIYYIIVIWISIFFGKEINAQFFVIFLTIIPLVFLNNENGITKWLLMFLSIPVWGLLEWIFTNYKPIMPLNTIAIYWIGNLNLIIVFIIILSLFVVFIDQNKKLILELNEKRSKLKLINDQLKQFAYMVSHDLKGPLRNISNHVDIINEASKNSLSPEINQSFNIIKTSTQKTNTLIKSILDYSLADKTELNIKTFTANEVLEDVLSTCFIPKNISVNSSQETITIKGSYIQLQQILSNLIDNAIKYNDKKKGVIEIDFSIYNEDYYLIKVIDNGTGIELKDRKKIFQIFETSKANRVESSTGIGLAIVDKLVKKNGGKISLKSKLKEGSTFSFTWPKVFPKK